MAYDAKRFNENASGMTGRGAIAVYDGTGTDAEGGDTLATIKRPGFFPVFRNRLPTEVFDAVRIASRYEQPQALASGDYDEGLSRLAAADVGPDNETVAVSYGLTEGQGLPIIIQARNGTEIDMLYEVVTVTAASPGPPPVPASRTRQLRLRGGDWNHT